MRTTFQEYYFSEETPEERQIKRDKAQEARMIKRGKEKKEQSQRIVNDSSESFTELDDSEKIKVYAARILQKFNHVFGGDEKYRDIKKLFQETVTKILKSKSINDSFSALQKKYPKTELNKIGIDMAIIQKLIPGLKETIVGGAIKTGVQSGKITAIVDVKIFLSAFLFPPVDPQDTIKLKNKYKDLPEYPSKKK